MQCSVHFVRCCMILAKEGFWCFLDQLAWVPDAEQHSMFSHKFPLRRKENLSWKAMAPLMTWRCVHLSVRRLKPDQLATPTRLLHFPLSVLPFIYFHTLHCPGGIPQTADVSIGINLDAKADRGKLETATHQADPLQSAMDLRYSETFYLHRSF